MIGFNKPLNLNGKELRQELRDAGVKISDNPTDIALETDGKIYLAISAADEAKAELVIQSHNGTMSASEQTVEDKLASVGLSLTDLKSALGL